VSARRSDQSDLWAQVGAVSGLGFVMFASIGGGFFLGWLVDRWLGTAPIFGLILAGLGLAGGLMEILQILKRVEKRAGRNDNGSSEN
jgi:F0F1-type ATP synthase assembly protein I